MNERVDVIKRTSWGGDVTIITITEGNNKHELITRGDHLLRYSKNNDRNYRR